jgi:hypothetical protein
MKASSTLSMKKRNLKEFFMVDKIKLLLSALFLATYLIISGYGVMFFQLASLAAISFAMLFVFLLPIYFSSCLIIWIYRNFIKSKAKKKKRKII